MPVRPRRQRRRRVEWSARIAIALTIGKPAVGVHDAALKAAWDAYGPMLLADYPPDRRPAGYWRFDPAVPDDLRGGGPALYPLEEAIEHRKARLSLELRRAAWLATSTGA